MAKFIMASSEKALSVPILCPKCAGMTGSPYRATTAEEGLVKVDLRCAACRHEWQLFRSEAPSWIQNQGPAGGEAALDRSTAPPSASLGRALVAPRFWIQP